MRVMYTILPIQYDYIFDEPAKSVTDYLKRIPREHAIEFALFISNFTDAVGWKKQLSRLPIAETIKIECSLKMISHERQYPNANYVLFTPLTGLELLKSIFAIPVNECQSVAIKWERFLIMAITLVNSKLIEEGPKFEDSSFNLFFKSVKHFRYEFDDRIVFYGSVYRAMCLLHFLEKETNGIWRDLRVELLSRLKCDSIRDYMKKYLDFMGRFEIKPKDHFQIFRGDKGVDLIQAVSIPYDERIREEDNKDYTKFKETPFVQIQQGKFAVIKNSFAANLCYNRLKFNLLSSYKTIKEDMSKGFFGTFNIDFIEKVLFVRILKYSFCSTKLPKYICVSEDECKERINQFRQLNPGKVRKNNCDNLMDGYVRSGNKILLIECKGKIISKEALLSHERLCKDITDSIVGEEGTGQLEKFCKRIINRDCLWDSNIPKYSIIYPLLVLDDIGFSADGFNQYVTAQTQEFVNDNKNIVRPFTVLDMDTFILISELIRKNKLNLFTEIENYHRHIRESIFDDQKISFATYLRSKYETCLPKVVSKWLKKLFCES